MAAEGTVSGVTGDVVDVTCDSGFGGGPWTCGIDGLFSGIFCSATPPCGSSDLTCEAPAVADAAGLCTAETCAESDFGDATTACCQEPLDCTATQVAYSDHAAEATITGATNDVVAVVCDTGYTGGGDWTCGIDYTAGPYLPVGLFTGLECTATACTATQVEFSNLAVPESVAGYTTDIVTIVCDQGYSGGGNITCLPVGVFETTTCEANSCAATQAANSDHAAEGAIAGVTSATVSVTCIAGFEGGGDWTCEPSGSFMGSPCLPIPCTPSQVDNSADYAAQGSLNAGTNEVIAVDCAAGYSGGGSYTCQANTTFAGAPCVADVCNSTEVANSDKATYAALSGSTGDVVFVTCNDGYLGGGGWTCGADGEFTGTQCVMMDVAPEPESAPEPEPVDANECDSTPCTNGGTCTDGLNAYLCACRAGYSGENCGTDDDECASGGCLNGATCTDDVDAYSCGCAIGYSGDNCNVNIDECQSTPCANEGTCVDQVGYYNCDCATGYSGLNCDEQVDPCVLNEDDCDDFYATCTHTGPGTHTCDCLTGYETTDGGTTCNDIDGCDDGCEACTLCVNSVSTCLDKPAPMIGYSCSCLDGYAGVDVEDAAANCVATVQEKVEISSSLIIAADVASIPPSSDSRTTFETDFKQQMAMAGMSDVVSSPDEIIIDSISGSRRRLQTDGVQTVVEEYDHSYIGIATKTTYRLRLTLPDTHRSLYKISGSAANEPYVPAAYFNAQHINRFAPPSLVNYNSNSDTFNDMMLSSFLSVGPDTNNGTDTLASTGTSGTALDAWAEVDNTPDVPTVLSLGPAPASDAEFSLFYMAPGDSLTLTNPLVAQLTLPSNTPFFARLGAQGQSNNGGADWTDDLLVWSHAVAGACAPGMTGDDCKTDIDECASSPCAGEAENTGCWNGVNEYICQPAGYTQVFGASPDASSSDSGAAELPVGSATAAITLDAGTFLHLNVRRNQLVMSTSRIVK